MNLDLRKYYTKKGFDFSVDDSGLPKDRFYVHTEGAQIGVKEIDI